MSIVQSAHDAIDSIASGDRVFVHGGVATPNALLEALTDRAADLQNVELIHLHTHGDARYARPEFANSFRVTNLFVGANMRRQIHQVNVDYLPCFLSEIPNLLRSGKRPVDVALIHVSPPDQHGYCTLGTSVDVTLAAVEAATTVIAQINEQMPRVHGDGFVHLSQIDRWIEIDTPLEEIAPAPIGEIEQLIGNYAAEIIDDGATLQMGIGSIPNAVLATLKQHRHLGIHTEMWSDGVLDLLECGAIDNSRKRVHPGKTVSGFVMGTQRLYDYIHDNPATLQLDIGYVNDPRVISRNPKVTAINSAVEIDLTGQICADSIGHRVISGVGGQMDFIRGASLSPGGKPIIALPSQTKDGNSRIVATLQPGAGVVTTRAHVHHVITEYGRFDLYGKTLEERALGLIRLAHPDHRETLAVEWRALQKSASWV